MNDTTTFVVQTVRKVKIFVTKVSLNSKTGSLSNLLLGAFVGDGVAARQ